MASKVEIRASTPQDEAEIVSLMRRMGLHVRTGDGWLNWKYWQARTDWPGTRSYVVVGEDGLLAHTGIIPGACLWGDQRATVIHMLDWAAAPEMVGAGVALLKHLRQMCDVLIGVGGSPYTRKALPMLGFKPCGESTLYQRVLNPWVQLRQAPSWSWKTLPKFGRDLARVWRHASAPPTRWCAHALSRADLPGLLPVLPKTGEVEAVLERSTDALTYFLDCPIAPMTAYAVDHAGQRAGYFVLAFAPGQARLVDCWVDPPLPQAWLALIALAVEAAGAHPGVGELVTRSSDAVVSSCLEQSGFLASANDPVMILPRRGLSEPPSQVRFQMLDSDAAFLY